MTSERGKVCLMIKCKERNKKFSRQHLRSAGLSQMQPHNHEDSGRKPAKNFEALSRLHHCSAVKKPRTQFTIQCRSRTFHLQIVHICIQFEQEACFFLLVLKSDDINNAVLTLGLSL